MAMAAREHQQIRWRGVLRVATKMNQLAPKLIGLETLVGPVTRLGHGGSVWQPTFAL
jgi:hypothetical protein